MNTPTALPQMAAPLQSILVAEDALGNTVAEVSAWPPKCRPFVRLERPFRGSYVTPEGVEFADINYPHYWKPEYRVSGGEEVLACGF